jgi:hypothetical protein
MNTSQILKRAWQTLWQYRALWIFGIILAITTAFGSGNNFFQFSSSADNQFTSGSQMEYDPHEPLWPQIFEQIGDEMQEAKREFSRLLSEENPEKLERTILQAAIIFTAAMIVLFLVGKVLRYVAETALIKMVDVYEETGEKQRAREGWRYGWSAQAWRIFLVDLVIFIPSTVIVILVMAITLAPIIAVSSGMPARGVLGLVASIGLILLFSLVALLVAALISLVKPVIRRKVVLEDLPVGQAFRQGFSMFRQYWKQYGLMWLILKGIDLVWPLVMLPFGLLSGGIGLLLGGGATLLLGGNAIQSGDPAMVWSFFVGILLLILVVAVPLSFIGGLRETFQSTSWTLTYREMAALKSLENGDAPVLDEG